MTSDLEILKKYNKDSNIQTDLDKLNDEIEDGLGILYEHGEKFEVFMIETYLDMI